MAVGIARKFLRSMAQPFEGNQVGISLWSVKDIEKREKRLKTEHSSTSEANENENQNDNRNEDYMEVDN